MKRKVNKKICNKCGDKFHPGILWRHKKFCGKTKREKVIKDEWKLPNGNFKCPYCDKEFSVYGICTHIYRTHTDGGKNQNPNIGYELGIREAWNKGKLTPDETKEKISKSLTGIKRPPLSDETKKKMSESRTKAIREGRVKRWQSISGNSYPEQYFNKVLLNEGLIFKSQYHIWSGSKNYFLDFYFEDAKVNLEIDGSQHKWEDRIKSDKIRDEYMKSIGIRVLRIEWKNPNKRETEEYFKNKISELKKLLES